MPDDDPYWRESIERRVDKLEKDHEDLEGFLRTQQRQITGMYDDKTGIWKPGILQVVTDLSDDLKSYHHAIDVATRWLGVIGAGVAIMVVGAASLVWLHIPAPH